jgi:hypothetical protein
MDEATIRMENPLNARLFFPAGAGFNCFAAPQLNAADGFPSLLDSLPWGAVFGNPWPIVSAERHGGQSGSVVKSGRRIGLPGVPGRFRIRHFLR